MLIDAYDADADDNDNNDNHDDAYDDHTDHDDANADNDNAFHSVLNQGFSYTVLHFFYKTLQTFSLVLTSLDMMFEQ